MQDRITRNRGNDGSVFCDDGDCMRYSIGDIKSNFEGAFDMLRVNEQVVFCYPYPDDGKFIHIVALLKGFL